MDLIEQHCGIARKITGRYIVKFNGYRFKDDLNSAAIEGVVVAVDRINRGLVKHNNYRGYICYYIHQYLNLEVRKNQTVMAPQRRKFLKCFSLNHINHAVTIYDFNTHNPNTHDTMEELEVIIDGDELLRQIVNLRIEGHTDQEIAELLNLPRLQVQRARTNLLKKWEKINA